MTSSATRWLVRYSLPLACVAAALPVIVSTITGLSEGWVPYGDQAVIASRAFDVPTSWTPLVGQYSASYHLVNHVTYSLGPMLYWLMALPARVGPPASLPLFMGLVNAASIAGVLVLARRRGGTALMLASALAVAVMCRSLVPETYHDIWNPSAAVLPFALLIFLCWSLACGEYRLLPLTLLVASFVAQCHLTYVVPGLALVAVGLGGLVLSRRWSHPADGRSLRRWALAALVVGVICWTAPAVQQLSNSPGNVTLVARAGTAAGAKVGWEVGWHAVVRTVGVPPWWLTVPTGQFDRAETIKPAPSALGAVSAALLLSALVAIAAVGLRRRRADLAAAAGIALALCAAVEAVTARTPANPHLEATLGYTLWWASPAGMFVWLALGFAAVSLLRPRARPVPARLRSLAPALGIFAALGIGAAVGVAEKPDEHSEMYRAIGTLGARVRASVPAGRVVSVDGSPGITSVLRTGLRYDLRRADIRAAIAGTDSRWGPWFRLGHRRYEYAIFLTEGRAPDPRRGRVVARVRFRYGPADYSIAASVARRVG